MPCGEAVTVSLVTPPIHGDLVSIVDTGSFTYQNTTDPPMSDSFVYQIACGDLVSASALCHSIFLNCRTPPMHRPFITHVAFVCPGTVLQLV